MILDELVKEWRKEHKEEDYRGAVLTESSSVWPVLRTLRLTHRRFAHLDILNSKLFRVIQLDATPDYVERFKDGTFDRIARHVDSVRFVPPLSWHVDFDSFHSNVTAYATLLHAQDLEKHGRIHEEDEGLAMAWQSGDPNALRRYEQDYAGDSPILSEEEVAEAWEDYQNTTNACKEMLENHDSDLMKVWLHILRRVGKRLWRVEFPHQICEDLPNLQLKTPSRPPGGWPCVFGRHPICRGTYKEKCNEALEVAATATFAAAVWCLAESGAAPQQLFLMMQFGPQEWHTFPGWDKLDLSHLRVLLFQPKIPDKEGNPMTALRSVIAKSHQSLEYLQVGEFSSHRTRLRWPSASLPGLPNLSALRIVRCELHAPREATPLAEWIGQMPELEHLQIWLSTMHDSFDAIPTGLYDMQRSTLRPLKWTPVLSAVSKHSNMAGPGLHVNFNFRTVGHRSPPILWQNFKYCRHIHHSGAHDILETDTCNQDNEPVRELDRMFLGRAVKRYTIKDYPWEEDDIHEAILYRARPDSKPSSDRLSASDRRAWENTLHRKVNINAWLWYRAWKEKLREKYQLGDMLGEA